MAKRNKIALIGAGNIGGELAALVARRQLGDVVLFDIPSINLRHALSVVRPDPGVIVGLELQPHREPVGFLFTHPGSAVVNLSKRSQ